MEIYPLFDMGNIWRYVPDGYAPAAQLYRKHYSAYKHKDNRRDDPVNPNRNQIIGPGEKLLLMAPGNDAVFAWRKFIDKSGQTGVNCAVFRNESEYMSSWLILQAELIAWDRWPGERLYTYVNPAKVRSKNPGYCFKMAGWALCGVTKKRKLLIFEKFPAPRAASRRT